MKSNRKALDAESDINNATHTSGTDNFKFDEAKETNNDEVKPVRPQERVTVAETLKLKLDRWVSDANTHFDGVVSVSKSDLINLLVKQHDDTLSVEELHELRREHYDEVKLASWLLEKVKDEKKRGSTISIQELLAKVLGGTDLTKDPGPKIKSSPRKKNY